MDDIRSNTTFRPNPVTGTLLSDDDAGFEAPHRCVLERESDEKEVAMRIESTTFGAITIDGKTYEHDVVIRLSGEVVKRKKKLSKNFYGTSHVLSKVEAEFLFEKGCDQVVIGSGQMGNVHLSPEAEAYFERKGCEILLKPTPEAIQPVARKEDRALSRDLLKEMPSWSCASTLYCRTVWAHPTSEQMLAGFPWCSERVVDCLSRCFS